MTKEFYSEGGWRRETVEGDQGCHDEEVMEIGSPGIFKELWGREPSLG